jgi:hypothetical protein
MAGSHPAHHLSGAHVAADDSRISWAEPGTLGTVPFLLQRVAEARCTTRRIDGRRFVQEFAMTCDEEIAGLERQCATAMLRGDSEACAAILADDYTVLEIIEDQPLQIVLKDDWLNRIKADARTAVAVEDIAVSTYGDVAVAVVKLTESTALTTRQLAVTDVWRKGARWQLVERTQSGALPKAV